MGEYRSENVKINLDNLPIWESGVNKGKINWKNNIIN